MSDHFKQFGFQHDDSLVMKFIGGSQLHGAKVDGTDDTDWYGVYVEPKELALGIDQEEHFVWTSGGKRGGNGPLDTDVCLYTLRKWARLAAKGNPSVLHFLFCKPQYQTVAWLALTMHREVFLAKTHIKQFLGFANAQFRRLYNLEGQKNVHRAVLEGEHGYDTKYAMHIIRLYLEAQELMEYGRITLPNPRAEELIAIRNGAYTLKTFEDYAKEAQEKTIKTVDKSGLPDHVDRKRISELVAEAYFEQWSWSKEKGLSAGGCVK